ncbi:MAG: hypothetical protein H0T89_05350 [Deltaproteobacteria bacterium]|nr:hypothetical protein [Deltaproteobacteria bacterium]MDQ3299978.1 hypothetical protein [Myxococcota bacterium]
MTIDHTPLDVAQLSPGAQRALGAGPSKLMAARGIMPLPPADQVAVLYQLSIDGDASLAQAARATATGMPEKLLGGTLVDPALDPRVLDFFASLHAEKPALFDAIVMNPAAADQTIAMLAGKGGAREVDVIAQNEQRLLRHPEIIAAMYMNRRARMSTIDRVVELAVRNQVRVPGLAAWDEVARALTGAAPSDPESDAMFAATAEALSGDDTPLTTGDAEQVVSEEDANAVVAVPEEVPISKMSVPNKIRLAQLGNAFARNELIRDPMRLVAMATIKSPGVTDIEAARYAANQNLNEDVIRYISQKREWTKAYGVKVSLCRNPKTPLAEAMKLLLFLRPKDLQNLSKSKGVPSALVAQCRKLMMARTGGSNK